MQNLTTGKPIVTWNLAGTIFWGVAIFVAYMLAQSLALAVLATLQNDTADQAEIAALFIQIAETGHGIGLATTISFFGVLIATALAIVSKKGAGFADYLGLALPKVKISAIFLGITALFILGVEVLNLLLDKPLVHEFMVTAYNTADPVWLMWVGFVVAAPLVEELMFRGFLLPGLANSFLGNIGAVVVSSAAWTLLHSQYGVFELSMVFIFGLILGYARIYSGSLWLPIALHLINNLIAVSAAVYFI